MKRSIGLLAVLALVLAACGTESDEKDPVVELGDGEPLLQITSEGGFVPVEVALANGPRYTLLDDGTLIHAGLSIAVYPGALLPPTMVVTLDADQMAEMRRLIDEIGLADLTDEIDNTQAQFVADATSEVALYWDDAGEHRLSVYALGIEQNPSDRNQAFLDLIAYLDTATASGPAEPYEAEELRVVAGTGFVDPEFQDIRDWPFETADFSEWSELPNGWYCQVIDGSQVSIFEDATQATQWQHPDPTVAVEPLTLLVRPVHPGEKACL